MINLPVDKYLLIILILSFLSCGRNQETSYEQVPQKNTNDKLIEINRILIQKDQKKIKDFIELKGWKMTKTKTGLWYEILKPGRGDSAKQGHIAKINYECSLLDGTVCYSSNTEGPKTFLIGKGNIETGLEEGILYLREESKARFILPPYLAHGLPGDGKKIPARAIILYEIELLSLNYPE